MVFHYCVFLVDATKTTGEQCEEPKQKGGKGKKGKK